MNKLSWRYEPGSHNHVKLEEGRADEAVLHPAELCISICQGFKERIEYDKKRIKCMGTVDQHGLECLVRDLVDTAEEFINENIANGRPGSHGDFPPQD